MAHQPGQKEPRYSIPADSSAEDEGVDVQDTPPLDIEYKDLHDQPDDEMREVQEKKSKLPGE
jgi:hypothetical protein